MGITPQRPTLSVASCCWLKNYHRNIFAYLVKVLQRRRLFAITYFSWILLRALALLVGWFATMENVYSNSFLETPSLQYPLPNSMSTILRCTRMGWLIQLIFTVTSRQQCRAASPRPTYHPATIYMQTMHSIAILTQTTFPWFICYTYYFWGNILFQKF